MFTCSLFGTMSLIRYTLSDVLGPTRTTIHSITTGKVFKLISQTCNRVKFLDRRLRDNFKVTQSHSFSGFTSRLK